MEGSEFFGFKNEMFVPDEPRDDSYNEINMEVNVTKFSRRPSIGPSGGNNNTVDVERMSFKIQNSKKTIKTVDEDMEFPAPPFELFNLLHQNVADDRAELTNRSSIITPPPPPPPPPVSARLQHPIKFGKNIARSERPTQNSGIGSLLDEFKSKIQKNELDDTRLVRASTLSFPKDTQHDFYESKNRSATLQLNKTTGRDKNFNRIETLPKPKRNNNGKNSNIGIYRSNNSSIREDDEEDEFSGFHNKTFFSS